MKNKKDKKYQDLIRKLKEFRSIGASDDLKDEIILLSKSSPNGNSHFGGIFFSKAIAFALVFLLLAGGTTLVAAQKSKPGQMLYPVKQAMEKIKQEPRSDTQDTEQSETKSLNDDQNTKQSTPSAETEKANDQQVVIDSEDENGEKTTTDIKDEGNLPTSKKDDVLGEIKEALPEEAQDAVQNAIDNPSPESDDKNQDNEKGQIKISPPVNVQLDLPEKSEEFQEENKGLKIDLNLPF